MRVFGLQKRAIRITAGINKGRSRSSYRKGHLPGGLGVMETPQ